MKGDRLWPAALVAVLAVTVAANGALFWAATRGEGAAAEPDYYRRAVAWDSTVALEAQSRALGWQADASLSAPQDGAVLAVVLRDATGAALAGLDVHVEGFAVAHGHVRVDARLREDAPGRYVLAVPAGRVEWFEFRFLARRGADRFAARVRCLPGQGCRAA